MSSLDPRFVACRSCGARIFFEKNEKGRRVPLDAQPLSDGNIWLGPAGVIQYRSRENAPPPDAVLYVSHFATCPHAKEWRKTR